MNTPKFITLIIGIVLPLFVAVAQRTVASGEAPPNPAEVVIGTGAGAEAVTFTAVMPQYNFSYGPDRQQPPLPNASVWSFYMPVQVNSQTPGWITGEYGIGGLYDTFYEEPGFTMGASPAGGCSWNTSYDSPPYWYYDGGSATNDQYALLNGPILRSESAIGSVYQSATQQVSGSGVPASGFAAMAAWDPHVYTSAPYLI
jgi:hypothetical protein